MQKYNKIPEMQKIMFLSVGMSEHETQVEPGTGYEVVLRIGKVEQVVYLDYDIDLPAERDSMKASILVFTWP